MLRKIIECNQSDIARKNPQGQGYACMLCYCALYRKGCVTAKAFYPSGQEIPWDKKSPGTRNPPGQEIPGTRNPPRQEIPWDKKSPGTRNPRDKKSPGTRNPPGQEIPTDQKSPGKSRAGTASIYIKEWQSYSFLPYLLLQYWS